MIVSNELEKMYYVNDMEIVFQTLLHKKLKEKVTGHIFIDINERDELFVDIQSNGLRYQKRILGVSDKILNGLTTDYAAYEIMKDYKNYIIDNVTKQFFK